LIGLSAPDDLPWILNLPDQPNILRYQSAPTHDTLKDAIQRPPGLEGLDVLAGYPDILSQVDAFQAPLDAPNSIVNLVKAALYGYAVVVLDMPANLPTAVLAAANTLVITARNTLECAVHTAGAIRLIRDTATWQRLSAIHIVLRVAPGRLSPDEWRRAAERVLDDSIPALLGQIPEDELVGATQDRRKLPLSSVDSFATAIRALGNSLLPVAAEPLPAAASREKRTLDLKVVKVKL
jgi:MinD-like ATPase involved in chromosome partitioning or flagellar assembly